MAMPPIPKLARAANAAVAPSAPASDTDLATGLAMRLALSKARAPSRPFSALGKSVFGLRVPVITAQHA